MSDHLIARRVGHLYPSGGISDHELQRMAPEGLRFLVTRMPFRDTSRESDILMARDVESHAGLLADAKVELIAFNCTAASMLAGPGVLERRIETATGIPAVTTIEAVMAGLSRFDARKVALFTAYDPDVVEEEHRFLATRGISVVAEGHVPCSDPISQGNIPPRRWFELVTGTDCREAEAILCSCAGIEISPVLSAIEHLTGKPVIASNAALLRLILTRLAWSSPVEGYGRLLMENNG
ncbi:hypothetical protein RGQ15_19160 [Paracoccus sp. MBLB3053]|uniref:Arylmalonate decarboxylase n=1 Tax=Paracoccus aurantius TaxID=3073814 RepID=A0ABU2HXC9_9RHOB|nr:hypothetical protein [Paracoccus sp. MBLB3053]MDS9469688.1 hypothetical protein [Paracoccus sp. MBLB3053]